MNQTMNSLTTNMQNGKFSDALNDLKSVELQLKEKLEQANDVISIIKNAPKRRRSNRHEFECKTMMNMYEHFDYVLKNVIAKHQQEYLNDVLVTYIHEKLDEINEVVMCPECVEQVDTESCRSNDVSEESVYNDRVDDNFDFDYFTNEFELSHDFDLKN
jgi:hypothetical protein